MPLLDGGAGGRGRVRRDLRHHGGLVVPRYLHLERGGRVREGRTAHPGVGSSPLVALETQVREIQ